jgi:hypothetical protein
MLTIEQVDAIRNNLEYYIKSELDGIIPPEIDSIFEILGEADNNNLSEILPVRDAKTPENNTTKYYSEPAITDEDYNFVEHTSECS